MLHSSGMDGWIGVKIGMQTQGRVPTTLAWGRVQGSGNRYGGSRGGVSTGTRLIMETIQSGLETVWVDGFG